MHESECMLVYIWIHLPLCVYPCVYQSLNELTSINWMCVCVCVHYSVHNFLNFCECQSKTRRVSSSLLLFDSRLSALQCLVFGLWALRLGPCVTDASNAHCLNISPRVSLLISVCHSYWFSKSLMLVKELITWIVAPLTPAPAAGFTRETSAFSQHSRLITHDPFQSQPDWPTTRRIMWN